MELERFLPLLAADAERLAAVAERGLDAAVPSCPGWAVRDVVEHVAFVYLHKVECMRRQARPDPWPPDLPERDPLELFREAYASLESELRTRGPAAPAYTWHPPDQTVGFWYRRMAQETAIHRVDVELAFDAVTPVDPELAADGVDEVLTLMLAGDWSDEPLPASLVGLVVELATPDRSWKVALAEESISVLPDGSPERAVARVSGPPGDLLLWAWGRGSIAPLSVDGDERIATAFRDQLATATQ